MESTPGEDAVRIDEMTTEGLEYYVNLVDKVEAGFERIDFSFEKSSSLHATEKLFVKGRAN